MKFKQSLQQGFTLIEMLVIAPIVVLAIGAFLTVIISMTGEVLASRGANTLTYNIQDALNRIDQDVKHEYLWEYFFLYILKVDFINSLLYTLPILIIFIIAIMALTLKKIIFRNNNNENISSSKKRSISLCEKCCDSFKVFKNKNIVFCRCKRKPPINDYYNLLIFEYFDLPKDCDFQFEHSVEL